MPMSDEIKTAHDLIARARGILQLEAMAAEDAGDQDTAENWDPIAGDLIDIEGRLEILSA